jgi:hypothetical protein
MNLDFSILDQQLLNRLKNEVMEVTKSLDKTGVKKYPTSLEGQQLRHALIVLIGEMQFHGIVEADLHVVYGAEIQPVTDQ